VSYRILVVDDDAGVARAVRLVLEGAGHTVEVAGNAAAAREHIGAGAIDLVVTDLKLPDGTGIEVLKAAKARDPDLPVMMITAFAEVETAVQAMKLGAFDYLAKPFDNERLLALVRTALRLRELARENVRLRRDVEARYGLAAIVGSSPAMEKVREQVRLAAQSDAAVLVQGETGTGKELVARAVHLLSRRARGPFVTVNCGAIPENLVESELFGHRKGSFTGAVGDFDGRFVQADAGTLFLDEVAEMKQESQVKLLRAIETKEVQPVGATRARSVDVRVISATNRELKEALETGRLRDDLFYRLNVFALRVPPLRDHREDIPELVAHYLRRRGFAPELAGPELLAVLADHDFPGNVRELQNVIESGLILSQGRELSPGSVADRLMPGTKAGSARPQIPDEGVSLAGVERDYLVEVLKKTGGNQSRAARLLGISRATLLYRMKKHGIASDL